MHHSSIFFCILQDFLFGINLLQNPYFSHQASVVRKLQLKNSYLVPSLSHMECWDTLPSPILRCLKIMRNIYFDPVIKCDEIRGFLAVCLINGLISQKNVCQLNYFSIHILRICFFLYIFLPCPFIWHCLFLRQVRVGFFFYPRFLTTKKMFEFD